MVLFRDAATISRMRYVATLLALFVVATAAAAEEWREAANAAPDPIELRPSEPPAETAATLLDLKPRPVLPPPEPKSVKTNGPTTNGPALNRTKATPASASPAAATTKPSPRAPANVAAPAPRRPALGAPAAPAAKPVAIPAAGAPNEDRDDDNDDDETGDDDD
jgi:hypothetical protein